MEVRYNQQKGILRSLLNNGIMKQWKLIEIQVEFLKSRLLSLTFHWSSRKQQIFSILVTHENFAADQNNPWLTIGTRQPPYLQWSHLSLRHFWYNKVESEFSPFIFNFCIWQSVITAQWLMENWNRLRASDKRQSLYHWIEGEGEKSFLIICSLMSYQTSVKNSN